MPRQHMSRNLFRYPDGATCTIYGCTRKAYARSWCSTHYSRWYEHGDPLLVLKRISKRVAAPDDERFWRHVDTSGDCLIWRGAVSRGYGTFTMGSIRAGNRRQIKAHNFAYTTVFGAIPQGCVLDHLCRTPLCVRPDHLEPVTARENVLRGVSPAAVNVRKTHCAHGHPYDATNTVIASQGQRVCRTCQRDRQRAYRARRDTSTQQ